MTKINFTKMHGAGNDFVLIDDRGESFPERGNLIAAMAADRTGIGCEGVVLVRSSSRADFRMTFYNPDGTEADLCGNGARCVAAFARRIGAARCNSMTFETGAGLVDAEIVADGLVKVWMPEPRDRRYGLSVGGVSGDYLVAGVPHFIVPVANVAKVDVRFVVLILRKITMFLSGFVSILHSTSRPIITYDFFVLRAPLNNLYLAWQFVYHPLP